MGSADDAENSHSGTFVVSSADGTAVVLQDVTTAQVHTVSASDLDAALVDHSTPAAATGDEGGVETGTILEETTVSPATDGVRWTVDAVGTVRWVPINRVDLEPTKRSRETAGEAAIGDLSTYDRAGEGAIHVLAVPPDRLAAAATEVVEDPATRRRAARLGVDRVQVRTGTTETDGDSEATGEESETGVLSVRYLPE